MLTSRSSRPRVVITMGDPSGIGPEVVVKALASPAVKRLANFSVVGDRRMLERTARSLGLKFGYDVANAGSLPSEKLSYGKEDARFGAASIRYIEKALDIISSGRGDCLVTAPVNKKSIRLAGHSGFQGHTEYIADRTGVKNYAMMFFGRNLKVTLATRHAALKNVSRLLSAKKIKDAILITDRYLKKYFGIRYPRIGVCALNPHAGERGAFGDEEKRIIAPAINEAGFFAKGVRGPLVPDVAFYDCLNGKFDAVVAMYHDQGLIPFKMLYFKDGVNLTLGLPFIRTSPDHGTAFNIAGKGVADPSSMIEAIRLACRLRGNQICSPDRS